MSEDHNFYRVAAYGDRLNPGQSLKIEHTLLFEENNADISELSVITPEKLKEMLENSIAMENSAYKAVIDSVKEWEKHGANTMLINKALEYVQTPVCDHSGNKWINDQYGNSSISNMTYKMSYHIYEYTKYDHAKGESVPTSWEVTWDVSTNRKENNIYSRTVKIAGQDRKRFTSKASMEKYLQGRVKAFSHLFTELSPPVPTEYAKCFKVNGMLLPGYTIAEDKTKQAEREPHSGNRSELEKPSILERIAESRTKQNKTEKDTSEVTIPTKIKSKAPEL